MTADLSRPQASSSHARAAGWTPAAATALGITLLAPNAWLVLLTDGVLVLGILAAAAGLGAPIASRLVPEQSRNLRLFCVAIAIGLGAISTITLTLGVIGILNRLSAILLCGAGLVSGLAWLYRRQSQEPPHVKPAAPASLHTAISIAGACLPAVPLVVMIVAACLPPGVLWRVEAGGYDVLEYHLQAPREYFDAGVIHFLPHNVYASFPQVMEMLYLLLMHLKASPHAAAIPAQLLHASLAVLAVLTIGAALPAGSPRRLGWLIAGVTPWVAMLGALAYVECGMLFFSGVAAMLVMDAVRERRSATVRLALTAGALAGLAGGCKYTALAMTVLPLGLAWALCSRNMLSARARNVSVFLIGAALAFSPWAIRNFAFTGNPFYPFAYHVFGGRDWSESQNRQWTRAHQLPEEQRDALSRAKISARELFGSSGGFGPALFILAAIGMWRARTRTTTLLLVWSLGIVAVWIAFTHLPGRFAVPLVIPLALLGGLSLASPASRLVRSALITLAGAGALMNDAALVRRFSNDVGTPTTVRQLVDATQALVDAHPLNHLPTSSHVLVVGDAAVFYINMPIQYSVVFSRDPWISFAQGGASPAACVEWLRERRFTHVAFAWSEIARLRSTYGFPAIVTPEWAGSLEQAGLSQIDAGGRMYDVYRVPP